MAWPCRPCATRRAPPLSLLPQPRPPCPSAPPHLPNTAYAHHGRGGRRPSPDDARLERHRHAVDVARARRGRTLATRHATTSSTPWTPFQQVEHHRTRTKPPDTLSTATRDRRRQRRRRNPAADTARPRSNPTALGTAYPTCRHPEDHHDAMNTAAPSPSSLDRRRARAHVEFAAAPRSPARL